MSRHLEIAIVNFNRHMKERKFPSCFQTEKDFLVWSELEDLAPTKVCRKLVCRDCCAAYQKQMTEAGRCFNAEVDIEKITK